MGLLQPKNLFWTSVNSGGNLIQTTSEGFFQFLHDSLFGKKLYEVDLGLGIVAAKRIRQKQTVIEMKAIAARKRQKEDYRHKVHARILSFLNDLKARMAPEDETWSIGGNTLEYKDIELNDCGDVVKLINGGEQDGNHSCLRIRTGMQSISLFIGNHYSEGGEVIELGAVLAWYDQSDPRKGNPVPPVRVLSCSRFTVAWGSEASFKEMEQWLENDVTPIFVDGIQRLATVLDGR